MGELAGGWGVGAAWWLWPALLLGLYYYLVLPREVAFRSDTNLYLAGTAGLVHGNGYRLEPYLDLPRPGVYPPLQSAWLAVFWRWGGDFPGNSGWLIFGTGLAAVIALGLLGWSLREAGVPAGWSALATLTLGLSHGWVARIHDLYSDILFSGLAFGLCGWGMRSVRSGCRPWWWWGIGGLLLALMWLTRSAAVGVIVAIVLAWVCDRRSRNLWCGAALLLPLGAAWWVLRTSLAAGAGYADYFRSELAGAGGLWTFGARLVGQACEYLGGRVWVELLANVPDRLPDSPRLAGTLTGWVVEGVAWLLGLVLVIACVRGWLLGGVPRPDEARQQADAAAGRERGGGGGWALAGWRRWTWWPRLLDFARSRESVVVWVGLGYFVQLLLWPYPLGDRALFPLLPLMVVGLWMAWSAGGPRPRLVRVALFVLLAANLCANGWFAAKLCRQTAAESRVLLHDLAEAARFLRTEATDTEWAAAGRDVPLLHLWTMLGRPLLANARAEQVDGRFSDVSPAQQGWRSAAYWVRVPRNSTVGNGTERLVEMRQFGRVRVERLR